MLQNLKLPICPKCGDTKYVEDDVTLSMKMYEKYHCIQCKIIWTPYKIIDEDGTEYKVPKDI